MSSVLGDLPTPAESQGQAAALVFDVDKDGVNDFVIASWNSDERVAWYRKSDTGWEKRLVSQTGSNLEAGGAYHDIDHDGDLDIVFGDVGGNRIYWWENPYPLYDPETQWTERLIKNSGEGAHHDMGFADVDGDGRSEFVSFNQRAKALLLFEVPHNPTNSGPWPHTVIYSWSAGDQEGLAFADVNLDGRIDIVAAGRWFERSGGVAYTPHVIDEGQAFARVAAGQLIPGGRPEVVLSPGDANGALNWYEWKDGAWQSHTLANVIHGHTLAVADVDNDGALDIVSGEMGEWDRGEGVNPEPTLSVYYGDKTGTFIHQTALRDQGTHEGRVADLDGDGDLDVLVKPFLHNTPRIDVLINESTHSLLPGDYNRDGRVNVADYTLWRDMLGASGEGLSADGDQNGFVDVADYDLWRANVGATIQHSRQAVPQTSANNEASSGTPGAGVHPIVVGAWSGRPGALDRRVAREAWENVVANPLGWVARFETGLILQNVVTTVAALAADGVSSLSLPQGPAELSGHEQIGERTQECGPFDWSPAVGQMRADRPPWDAVK